MAIARAFLPVRPSSLPTSVAVPRPTLLIRAATVAASLSLNCTVAGTPARATRGVRPGAYALELQATDPSGLQRTRSTRLRVVRRR